MMSFVLSNRWFMRES